MATTYTLISSNTLGSSVASVTFSSIPSTYTDLILYYSVRTARVAGIDLLRIRINTDTTANNFKYMRLSSDASTASSDSGINLVGYADDTSNTTNTFSSGEIYIPSYNSSSNKPYNAYGATENNTTTAYMAMFGNLWLGTSAINQIIISSDNTQNLLANSSFHLYGIKNS